MTDRPPTVAEEIREATREAHAAIKDLKGVIREAREAQRQVESRLEDLVEEAISEEIQQGLTRYQEELNKAITDADRRVHKRFDHLTNILLHGNAQGRGPSIVEEALEQAEGSS